MAQFSPSSMPPSPDAAANRLAFGDTAVATVNPGEYLVLRWFAPNDAGNDHGVALDDLTVTAVNPVPVPEHGALLAGSVGALGPGRGSAGGVGRGGDRRPEEKASPSPMRSPSAAPTGPRTTRGGSCRWRRRTRLRWTSR
jgi:hypothetical protein